MFNNFSGSLKLKSHPDHQTAMFNNGFNFKPHPVEHFRNPFEFITRTIPQTDHNQSLFAIKHDKTMDYLKAPKPEYSNYDYGTAFKHYGGKPMTLEKAIDNEERNNAAQKKALKTTLEDLLRNRMLGGPPQPQGPIPVPGGDSGGEEENKDGSGDSDSEAEAEAEDTAKETAEKAADPELYQVKKELKRIYQKFNNRKRFIEKNPNHSDVEEAKLELQDMIHEYNTLDSQLEAMEKERRPKEPEPEPEPAPAPKPKPKPAGDVSPSKHTSNNFILSQFKTAEAPTAAIIQTLPITSANLAKVGKKTAPLLIEEEEGERERDETDSQTTAIYKDKGTNYSINMKTFEKYAHLDPETLSNTTAQEILNIQLKNKPTTSTKAYSADGGADYNSANAKFNELVLAAEIIVNRNKTNAATAIQKKVRTKQSAGLLIPKA